MSANPICEDCDLEMAPFAAQEGDRWVEGYGCIGCGWSFDTNTDDDPDVTSDPAVGTAMTQHGPMQEKILRALEAVFGLEEMDTSRNAPDFDLINDMYAAAAHCFVTQRPEDQHSKVLREALLHVKKTSQLPRAK